MNRFNSILIANRGEIACRVIRTANESGYRTIAVYSDADEEAPHVKMATDALRIGPGPVTESYLVPELILQAAADSGAGAIHPGYGFLSENAEFARACEASGLVFIGPTADAIDVMGNKGQSKRRMLAAGVPCVPGYQGLDQCDATLLSEGEKIDLPLMVKAAAGGGGRGMRLVQKSEELPSAIKLARAEAEGAFGSGELILEQAIIQPRHVEIQIFADSQGHTVHLGERDCSVQRRHQKVVEEAPCPIMTAELRQRMGQSAIDAAVSVGYRGAGTVEFLLDDAGMFYFLEMNTRLQVEHPVTELITGLDLVALQISVAQGEPLGIQQSAVELRGHAIEVRLYTEDPAADFLPAAGPVDLWLPASGPDIRIDAGITTGQHISPFYDPMVAKIIGYGTTREAARLRTIEALQRTVLFGPPNNRQFLLDCLRRECFVEGRATTGFIAEEFTSSDLKPTLPSFAQCAIAAVIDLSLTYQEHHHSSTTVSSRLKDWTNAGALVSRKQYLFDSQLYDLSVSPHTDGGGYRVYDGEQSVRVEVLSMEAPSATVSLDDSLVQVYFMSIGRGQLHCLVDGYGAFYRDMILLEGVSKDRVGDGRVVAPMHGSLLEVAVAVGDSVSKGQLLAVLEAMKMHYEIVAEVDGEVVEVSAVVGDQVAVDAVLVEIKTVQI